MRARYDVLILGGGPAGLHAALKAAVLNHTALVVDKGRAFSRVSQARALANVPFAPGISGAALLDACRRDLDRFADLKGVALVDVMDGTEAFAARSSKEGYHLTVRGPEGEREVCGRVLLIATGVVDRKPGIERFHDRGHDVLRPYMRDGQAGYCVLCEGWRIEGKRVLLVGSGDEADQVALDMRDHFGADVTQMDEALIRALRDEDGHVVVDREDGQASRFDVAFFHLGLYKANNELAVALGADTDREGHVRTTAACEAVDRDGRAIPGLYVVGDLRAGAWKQVVIAWGDAETAIISAYATRLP